MTSYIVKAAYVTRKLTRNGTAWVVSMNRKTTRNIMYMNILRPMAPRYFEVNFRGLFSLDLIR